jgi:hypothetical protein
MLTEGTIFNRETILSNTFYDALRKVKSIQEGTKPKLYMSCSLLDLVCRINSFPTMGWNWNKEFMPIHVYCKELWEHKYTSNMDKYLIISLLHSMNGSLKGGTPNYLRAL